MARLTFVTDTHAILWHLFPTPRTLGTTAQAAFGEVDAGRARMLIPAVVAAEMLAVVERGRLAGITVPDLLDHFKRIQRSTNYQFLSLRTQTVIDSHALTAIPEIFDRLIVAEALRVGAPLITRDEAITASGLVRVIWD